MRKQTNRTAVTVLGPDLQPVGWRTMVPFTPTFGELHAEGWRGIFSVAGTLELSIEQFGPHSVQIDIDGKQAGDIPFRAGHADA
jgi:hypothetical protein